MRSSLPWLLLGARALALHPPHLRPHVRPRARPRAAADDGDGPEYLNKFTQLLGRLLPAADAATDTTAAAEASALDEIEWTAPKTRGLSLDAMCAELDQGLREREWFVRSAHNAADRPGHCARGRGRRRTYQIDR